MFSKIGQVLIHAYINSNSNLFILAKSFSAMIMPKSESKKTTLRLCDNVDEKFYRYECTYRCVPIYMNRNTMKRAWVYKYTRRK